MHALLALICALLAQIALPRRVVRAVPPAPALRQASEAAAAVPTTLQYTTTANASSPWYLPLSGLSQHTRGLLGAVVTARLATGCITQAKELTGAHSALVGDVEKLLISLPSLECEDGSCDSGSAADVEDYWNDRALEAEYWQGISWSTTHKLSEVKHHYPRPPLTLPDPPEHRNAAAKHPAASMARSSLWTAQALVLGRRC